MRVFLVIVFLAFTSSASAETFTVSTTPELRQALRTAASNGENDIIILDDGIYKTTDDEGGTFLYLSSENKEVRLEGSSNSNVILSGDNLHQVIRHKLTVGVTAELRVSNISIIDGTNQYSLGEYGGGILSNSSVVIDECSFRNNVAALAKLSETSYQRTYGGAIFADSVSISNSSFVANQADAGGGAVAFVKDLFISDSIFEENTSPLYGGAVHGHTIFRNYEKQIVNSSFKNNSARYGGALSITDAVVINSKFYRNSANAYGGAIHSFAGIKIYNSIFDENSAIRGASLYNGNGALLANNLLKSNYSTDTLNATSNVYLSEFNGNDTLVNNIFRQNQTDIEIRSNVLMTLKNNYIDLSKVGTDFIDENNFFSGVILGFADEINGDYSLTVSSDLIDAGTTNISDGNLPETDIDGNVRVSGNDIDVGPSEFVDSDGDGVADSRDAFPNDTTETSDSDSDGVGDNVDAFPLDASESLDTDGDGIGNNSDMDDDGDGVADIDDAFPLDAVESLDTDGDGIGNNADTDDDGDGYSDLHELEMGSDPLNSSDMPRSGGLSPALLRAISQDLGKE